MFVMCTYGWNHFLKRLCSALVFLNPKTFTLCFFLLQFSMIEKTFALVETNFSAGGAVIVGDAADACAPAIEGAIRFDADGANTLDYCDGANWLSLLTSSVGAGIVNNGNSFAAPMIIGTNDTNTLSFETDGTTRVTIDTSGNVGIGTTAPLAELDVDGTGALVVPRGTTLEQPGTGANGMIRYNTDNNKFEAYENSAWTDMIASGGGGSVLDDLTDVTTDYTTDDNMFLGSGAGGSIASGGTNNLALGRSALGSLTTGDNNVAVGLGAAGLLDVSSGNTLMGVQAMSAVTDSSWGNSVFGFQGFGLGSGGWNSTLGSRAMRHASSSNYNVAIGNNALDWGKGNYNVAIGFEAAQTSGSSVASDRNVFIGRRSGAVVGNVADNVFVGDQTGDSLVTGNNNILIGPDIDVPAATTSNYLSIGNSIYGNLSSGNIGIGTSVPNGKLDVAGDIRMLGATSGYTGLQAPATAPDLVYTLPGTAPSAGQVLQSDASGVLSWAATGGSGDFMADGSVAMTGQFEALSGDATSPGLSFAGDTDTGFFRSSGGGDRLNVTVGGSEMLSLRNSTGGDDANILVSNTAGGFAAVDNLLINTDWNNSGDGDVIFGRGSRDLASGSYQELMRLDGATGNLGIGTSNPIAPLDVNGNLRVEGTNGVFQVLGGNALNFSRNGQNYINATAGASSEFNFDSTLGYRFEIANTEQVRIDSAGNVGIGTTTPMVELDVNTGTINAASICDENNANCLDLSAGVGGSGDFMADGSVAMTGPFESVTGTNLAPGITFNGDEDTGFHNGYAGAVSFSSNGTDRFTMDTNYFFGSVTGSPALSSLAGSAASPSYTFLGDQDTGLFRPNADSIGFSTGGTESMVLSSSGDLFIKDDKSFAFTNSSSTDYTDTVIMRGFATSGSGSIGFRQCNNSTCSSYSTLLTLRRGDVTSQSDIYSALNLGSVYGNQSRPKLFFNGDSDTGLFSPGFNQLAITIGGSEAMRVNTSGNVGIGTTAPAVELDVNTGTINAASICDENNANCLDLSAGVGGSGDFLADGTVPMTGALRLPDGTMGAPALTFSDDTDTGLFSDFNGVIHFAADGSEVLTMSNNALFARRFMRFDYINVTQPYSSSSLSVANPGVGIELNNMQNVNNNYSGISFGAHNGSATKQEAYFGVTANSSGNTPEIVIGQQTGASAYNERMRIDSSGNVGIGTTTPAQALDVVGNIQYTGSLIDASDRRLKRDIASLENPLAVITAIEGVSFIMKDDPSNQVEYGVIAQQVEKVLPELVHTKDDDLGSKAVNYIGFIGWIIEGVKELNNKCEATEADLQKIGALSIQNKRDIASLKQEVADKDMKIQKLESELQQIKELLLRNGIQ